MIYVSILTYIFQYAIIVIKYKALLYYASAMYTA